MAILEGGHIVPPPHSSYIQKPRAIRVNNIRVVLAIAKKRTFVTLYYKLIEIENLILR